ncbi:hypothetical protein LTR78_004776 [Recurvomyces mirabilis]|uniref:Uncharacterized protein n=1 Tax=Recurvomyces mirabilis TaxID=574656 RepID=A0AAE0WNW8_9PEZI|nr:hypothetical protein LTR78_004776 [Recurvomyces mirabilis]KAK5157947.1 hypothetical protein LTS14_003870 [Recurvomyces mirabilis]
MADKDFSARETEIMAKAWNCMVEEPKVSSTLPSLRPPVDYEKLAKACGMTNPRSATNAWRAIKTKIMARGGITKTTGKGEDADGEGGETPVNPTPKKRGKGKTDADGDGESPTKKAKGSAKGKKKSEEVVGEADDDEDGEGGKVVKGEPEVDGDDDFN